MSRPESSAACGRFWTVAASRAGRSSVSAPRARRSADVRLRARARRHARSTPTACAACRQTYGDLAAELVRPLRADRWPTRWPSCARAVAAADAERTRSPRPSPQGRCAQRRRDRTGRPDRLRSSTATSTPPAASSASPPRSSQLRGAARRDRLTPPPGPAPPRLRPRRPAPVSDASRPRAAVAAPAARRCAQRSPARASRAPVGGPRPSRQRALLAGLGRVGIAAGDDADEGHRGRRHARRGEGERRALVEDRQPDERRDALPGELERPDDRDRAAAVGGRAVHRERVHAPPTAAPSRRPRRPTRGEQPPGRRRRRAARRARRTRAPRRRPRGAGPTRSTSSPAGAPGEHAGEAEAGEQQPALGGARARTRRPPAGRRGRSAR